MSKLLKNRDFWLTLALVALIFGVALRAPGFGTTSNLLDIFNNTSILMILALGQMVVILTRSIDLSMAANLALSGMIVAILNAAYPGIPVPILMTSPRSAVQYLAPSTAFSFGDSTSRP